MNCGCISLTGIMLTVPLKVKINFSHLYIQYIQYIQPSFSTIQENDDQATWNISAWLGKLLFMISVFHPSLTSHLLLNFH